VLATSWRPPDVTQALAARPHRVNSSCGLGHSSQGALCTSRAVRPIDSRLLAQGRTWLQTGAHGAEDYARRAPGLGIVWYLLLLDVNHVVRDGPRRCHRDHRHMSKAAENGHFSGGGASTFLMRSMLGEALSGGAIPLGQALRPRFLAMGYYALVTGVVSARRGHLRCVPPPWPSGEISRLRNKRAPRRETTADLCYCWGRPYETAQDALWRSKSFRQAVIRTQQYQGRQFGAD